VAGVATAAIAAAVPEVAAVAGVAAAEVEAAAAEVGDK